MLSMVRVAKSWLKSSTDSLATASVVGELVWVGEAMVVVESAGLAAEEATADLALWIALLLLLRDAMNAVSEE